MFLCSAPCADLGGLPTRGRSALLLLMLLGSLGNVSVADQAAEQGGNLWPDVQLFLEEEEGGGGCILLGLTVYHVAEILGNKNRPQTKPSFCHRSHSSWKQHLHC